MTPTRLLALMYITSTITACGPCDAYVDTLGDVDICLGGDGGVATPSDDGGSSGAPTEAGESTGDVCDLAPGNALGPCVDGVCGAGLVCAATMSGSICVTLCDVNFECPQACGDAVSDSPITCSQGAAPFCVAACDTDADCNGGTICDEATSRCVWAN